MEKNKNEIPDGILEQVSGGTGETPILREDLDLSGREIWTRSPRRCIRCQRPFGSLGENVCPDCEKFYRTYTLERKDVGALLQVNPELVQQNPFKKLP